MEGSTILGHRVSCEKELMGLSFFVLDNAVAAKRWELLRHQATRGG
jgi:hypothetical protein